MHVRRIIRDKEGVARFVMGNNCVRARHNAAQHGDLALVHRPPAPIGNHVAIDIGDLWPVSGTSAGSSAVAASMRSSCPRN